MRPLAAMATPLASPPARAAHPAVFITTERPGRLAASQAPASAKVMASSGRRHSWPRVRAYSSPICTTAASHNSHSARSLMLSSPAGAPPVRYPARTPAAKGAANKITVSISTGQLPSCVAFYQESRLALRRHAVTRHSLLTRPCGLNRAALVLDHYGLGQPGRVAVSG